MIQQFITETKIFIQSGQTDTQANAVLFINTGTINVTIDGLVLQPSQSWDISGNRNEMLVKVYTIYFSTTTGASCTVIYKRYL